MSNVYYEQELNRLKSLARDFSRANPSIAPMLGAQSSDPDVERLLEGVAFLTGIVHQRLDDEFPEFIQEIARVLFSQFLRPVPCATILRFSPRGKLTEPILVPRGTQAASVPVEGTSCLFETCQDVEIHPLTVTKARADQEAGKPGALHLTLELSGIPLEKWSATRLRFFLGGSYAEASHHFGLLTRELESIEIGTPGGAITRLPPTALEALGFSESSTLFPVSPGSFSPYRLFQEFFVMPAKFLFLDLTGLDRWHSRGNGNTFTLTFRLSKPPVRPLSPEPDHFILGATTAVNLFEADAEPISVDHRTNEYLIRPSGTRQDHYDIFSVESVEATETTTGKKLVYQPFQELLGQKKDENTRAYRTIRRSSSTARRADTSLGLLYGKGEIPHEQTVSVRIRATNRFLPESLKPGEITRTTDSSPERLSFTNLTAPTPYIQPPLGDELSWRILSQMGINFLSLADASRLRSLLSIYLFPMERNKALEDTNRKRINSIEDVNVSRENRLIRGILLRGSRIRIRIRGDGFADSSDLILFGMILNEFLSVYASINAFIKLEIENTLTGEIFAWPERLGTQTLI